MIATISSSISLCAFNLFNNNFIHRLELCLLGIYINFYHYNMKLLDKSPLWGDYDCIMYVPLYACVMLSLKFLT